MSGEGNGLFPERWLQCSIRESWLSSVMAIINIISSRQTYHLHLNLDLIIRRQSRKRTTVPLTLNAPRLILCFFKEKKSRSVRSIIFFSRDSLFSRGASNKDFLEKSSCVNVFSFQNNNHNNEIIHGNFSSQSMRF